MKNSPHKKKKKTNKLTTLKTSYLAYAIKIMKKEKKTEVRGAVSYNSN